MACATDQDIAALVFAAEYNGRADWVEEWKRNDASAQPWHQKRCAVIDGFCTGAKLPVADAWPVGPAQTSFEGLRRASARLRWRDACARNWWRSFVAAPDAAAAYAAWVLYRAASEARETRGCPGRPTRTGTQNSGA